MDPKIVTSIAVSPSVTVIMANYNGARFIGAALRSVLSQTLRDFEVLVIDDASTDESVEHVRAVAAQDSRVRLIECSVNGGPAAARNRGLDAARGRWIAIVDNDDLIHPARLEHLIDAAEREGADMIADNLLIFDDANALPPKRALPESGEDHWIEFADYVRSNCLFRPGLALGYLKPIIRAETIRRAGIRYDPSLRIAEDYDFIVRLLITGARFRLVRTLSYFYRKHTNSISHRLSADTIRPMLQADDRLRADIHASGRGITPEARSVLDERRHSLEVALGFDEILAAFKAKNWVGALVAALRNPAAAMLLRIPVRDRLVRLRSSLTHPSGNNPEQQSARGKQLCVLSRQRVVGNTNGSSTYLLSLCAALTKAGWSVHFLSPSPATFGSWPVLAMRPETTVFRSITIRGGWRLGRFVIASDPRIGLRAAWTVLARIGKKLGFDLPSPGRAPYSVAVPWTDDERLFIARHARGLGDALIADYAFLTEAIPYALRPDSRSAVVMHDLFSSRKAQFDRMGEADSVATLDTETEMGFLALADGVIAIQQDEASIVRRHLPNHPVLVAPMAIDPVVAPQPGHGHTVLFVGSNTAPNVHGLRWLFETIWPDVRRAVSDATLNVAGSVANAFRESPPGVHFLGQVADLAPLYRSAAVVISPLLAGSGLKIKLIEALGHGKAIVATSTTLQGVEALVGDAVAVSDDASEFAQQIIVLLRDEVLRRQRAVAALGVAREHFSSEACYQQVVRFFNRGPCGAPPGLNLSLVCQGGC